MTSECNAKKQQQQQEPDGHICNIKLHYIIFNEFLLNMEVLF